MTLTQRWQRLDKGQLLKWTIYSLLLVNWVFYAFEEHEIASHTLRQGGSIMAWAQAFATTIDEAGWFILLLMFELETYVLEDKAFERRGVAWSIHGVRLACYVMLAHTVLARYNDWSDTAAAPVVANVTGLCQLADQDISFGYNYEYEIITAQNCRSLSSDTRFVRLDPTVVTDSAGHQLEQRHTWIDLQDAVTWLLVIWSVELAVWLQNRNITGGRLMLASRAAKFFYAVLFGHAAWWLWTGHPVWAWDQFLWICGFWAIENNLSEWRDDIRARFSTA